MFLFTFQTENAPNWEDLGHLQGFCCSGIPRYGCRGTSLEYFLGQNDMAVCQNLVPLVNIKLAGKWMVIPPKMVLIGIDPYPMHI